MLYPITVGDLRITAVVEKIVTSQTMPTELNDIAYFGDCSFKFQK